MKAEEVVYFAAVLLVGLPAALAVTPRLRIRNATALALVLTWFAGYGVYLATGEGMPINVMILFDSAVLTTIYGKEDWHDCSPYNGLRFQLCALWLERSPWDRAIIAIYPVAWLFYFPIADSLTQYWVLWTLALAQMLLAGWEAAHPWLEQHPLRAVTVERPPPGSEFHAAWRLTGHG